LPQICSKLQEASEVSKGKSPVCSGVRRKISTEKKTESGFQTKPDSSAAPSKSIVPPRKHVQISFIYLLNGKSMVMHLIVNVSFSVAIPLIHTFFLFRALLLLASILVSLTHVSLYSRTPN
jgi:hypothetical protein